jgi:hypothetical protein
MLQWEKDMAGVGNREYQKGNRRYQSSRRKEVFLHGIARIAIRQVSGQGNRHQHQSYGVGSGWRRTCSKSATMKIAAVYLSASSRPEHRDILSVM